MANVKPKIDSLVSRPCSRNTPPKKGLKKRAMKASEKPFASRNARVLRSPATPGSCGSSEPARQAANSRLRSRAVRRPSPTPTMPERSDFTAAHGRRHGSLTSRSLPPSTTSAPGSNQPN